MEKTHRISAKVERAVSFSSMIFLARLEGVDQLNDELTSLILERQNSDSGRQRSNRGGWSSGNDTLRWPDAAMQLLFRSVIDVTGQVLGKHYPQAAPITVAISDCWANVNPQGAWRVPHYHEGVAWSACYYVKAEEEGEPLGGISFINPLHLAGWLWQPQQLDFTPRTGDLLIFPGHMMHYVYPNPIDAPRISVAFNFEVKTERLPWQSGGS